MLLVVKPKNVTVLGGDTYLQREAYSIVLIWVFYSKEWPWQRLSESIDVEIEELCEPHPYCLKISWSPHPVPGPSPVMLWIPPPQLCKSVTNVTRPSPVPAEWGRQGSASFRPQPPPALITDKSVSKGKTRKVKGDMQHRGEDVKVVLQNVSIVRIPRL